jgi:hypothetical protein
MVDKTLEAFGLTREDMEQANQQAADQMLPMPYDIPGEVGPVKEDRFGDTAAWAAKDSWEEAKARFQSRGTEEGVAGAIPEADSSVLNTFASGLGYAADMGLSGLAASDAAWRYSVGLVSELGRPFGASQNQKKRFTRDFSSIPDAFMGNVTGVVGGIDKLPDVRQATTGARMAAEDVLDAMPEYDPNRVNIFGGIGARDPAYGRTSGYLPESVGADGQYRFEIDDSPMEVLGSNIKAYSVPDANSLIKLPKDTSKLKDVMVHDEFFRQYPELGDIPVIFNNSLEYGHHGSLTTFDFKDGTQKSYLQLNPQMLLGEPELLKRVLIHEIQHAVQEKEGFAGGTSPNNKDVREQAAFEIESPENVEIWNQYTKDLEDFKRPENLVAPLEAAKDFILAYSDKNGIRLRDPNFLDRIKDRFTGREQSIVEGNLKIMLNSVEDTLEKIKSGADVKFDYTRGGVDTLYRKLGSIVGEEDKDLFEGIIGFSPDVINPKGYGLGFDTMEYFTEVPLLPDLPAPGTDKFSGIPENLLYSIYRRKRGEVEAENAAIRAEMSLQERFDTSPEDTELTGQGLARSRQWGDPYNSGGSNSSSKSYSYFDEGALKEAANQNDKSREILVDMPIDDFLEAAKKEVSESKLEGTRALVAEGTPFNSIPQLSFKNNGDGTGRVTGHEGRHRAMALREQGETTIPVRLMSEGGTGPSIRWGQQNNPNSPDYVEIIPQSLIAEEGTGSVSMPRLAAEIRPSQTATITPSRNANLDNWSENAYFKDAEGLPQQLYHGMSGNLRGQPVEFSGENLEPSYMGTLGPGTYLTRDPSVASDFATGKRGGYTDEKFGGQVIPVYTNVTKVVDDDVINSNKELRTEIADLIEENTDDNYLFNLADKLRSEDDINLSSLFTKTEDGKVRSTGVGSLVSSLLESKGYEGISVVTDKGFHEAVIFPGHGGVEFPRQNIKSSLQGPEGQYSRETNDMRFAEGGLAMERQMNTMMAEGGIKDSGMNRDPISGNEIPAGSLAKEVRDDVDAKLSEGEYVVPADVVRYFGVNYFEKLREKAKAGLQKMDEDGRIGGDPVDEQMGSMMDDGLPFSDEELMSIDDEAPIGMAEGGAVASGARSAFNPMAFRPGFSFGLAGGSGQGLPSETKTFVNAQGEVRSILFINGQPIQQIPSGFVEDTPENRAKFTEGQTAVTPTSESSRDRDNDRGVQVPQGSSGERSDSLMSEEDVALLSKDPLAFGKAALEGNRFLNSETLGTIGSLINPALGVLGGSAGTYMEMQNIADARAAKKLMEDRKLTDTEEYRTFASDLKAREDKMSMAAKGADAFLDFSGDRLFEQAKGLSAAPMTPQAIPTSMTYAPAVTPSVDKSGSGMVPSSKNEDKDSDYSPPTTAKKSTPAGASTAAKAKVDAGSTGYSNKTSNTTTKKSTPAGASTAAKAKVDAGSTGYSNPKKETFAEKESRGWSSLNKGGLVQRPKKKPVAKK